MQSQSTLALPTSHPACAGNADVTGLPISSIRDLITETELRDIERLALDDERAEGFMKALARFTQE